MSNLEYAPNTEKLYSSAKEYCAGFENGKNALVTYIDGLDDPETKLALARKNNAAELVTSYWQGAVDGYQIRKLLSH